MGTHARMPSERHTAGRYDPVATSRLHREFPNRLSERSVTRAGRCGEDETCDLLWLVDLNVVPGTGNQEQLRGREQLVELPCHSFVQVGVCIAEDDPYRAGEGPHVRDHPPAADRGRQEVVIQCPERRPFCTEVRVQARHDLLSHLRISDESADLPEVEPPVEAIGSADDRSRGRPHHWCGVQRDRSGASEARRPLVIRVQKHERGHAVGVEQRPVDPGRARSVVDNEYGVLQPELFDDGLDLAKLVASGRTVRGGLVGKAPAQEVEGHDSAGRGHVWDHPVVQVKVVGKSMHQKDRVPLTRVVADVDPMAAPLNRRLLEGLASSLSTRHLGFLLAVSVSPAGFYATTAPSKGGVDTSTTARRSLGSEFRRWLPALRSNTMAFSYLEVTALTRILAPARS